MHRILGVKRRAIIDDRGGRSDVVNLAHLDGQGLDGLRQAGQGASGIE
jgi:hypothetical protein